MNKLNILFLSAFVSACSLVPSEQSDTTKLFVNIHTPAEKQKLNLLAPFMLASTVPSSYSGFECYGINIMGPGIKDIDGVEDTASILSDLYSGTSYCSYPGVTSKPITGSGTQTVELVVPAGKSRLIQYIGISDATGAVCSSAKTIGENQDDSGVSYYEIGRTITDLFTETAVGISNSYDTASNQSNRQLNCGGSCSIYAEDNQLVISVYDPLASTAANSKQAQSFVPVTGFSLDEVVMTLSVPTGSESVKLEIYSDNGSPSEPLSLLYTADSAATVNSSTATEYSFFFDSNPTLTGGTTYWMVLSANATFTTNPLVYGDASDSYASGEALSWSGPNWSPPSTVTGDFAFQLYSCD